MAYYTRDRTEELRGSFERNRQNEDEFGPSRVPAGYFSTTTSSPRVTQSRTNRVQEQEYEMQPVRQLNTNEEYLAEIEYLKGEITRVNQNIDRIQALHEQALSSNNYDQNSETHHQLEQLQTSTRKIINAIKQRVMDLEASNAALHNNPSVGMRRSQSATLRKRFTNTIQRYQEVEVTYQKKYRTRMERQIRIVRPDATEQDIEAYMGDPASSQIFAQTLLQSNRLNQAQSVLSEVQTRHDDIRRIEKTIVELSQLFEDMRMLTEQQGETLTQVDQHAEAAVQDMHKGNEFLHKAVNTARAIRHKKWYCLILFIILAVVIAILVWWFGFGHPGVN